ncbi:MAG: ligase-associated DNA damage response endonuclease PdeM [Alphaproteobacteria bacterium]|nr:ligase-associated DNA damage response endonuclease PdeM [Alphaproteobacteria bacterium]
MDRYVFSFTLVGTPALADADGVLVLPDHQTLIVSDLHFEKGSAFARSGQMLPPYDTRTTLRRLGEAIEAHRPDRVIALGDSFHDMWADERMDERDRAALKTLVGGIDHWVWIEGNHDPQPPEDLGGEILFEFKLGGLVFRHEPLEGVAPGEIAGHLHPCAKVRGRGRSVRRRCFATDGTRLIMPAFGAYTGGLNIRDDAFSACFGRTPDALVMGRDAVHVIAAKQCVPDRPRLRA